ncbi:MAG: double-strand break repair helicase AddA [Rhodovarius sp.]|nr:double-strand break repair helicase AddA [Rhodovarius sp.]
MSENPAQRAAAAQARAADPAASAFVSASAGSGKTKLLVDRLLRLMLSGTPPGRILCLTFTRAAAAEMAQRLHRALGELAVAEDQALAGRLSALLGRDPKPAEAQLARRLFAEVLELPGGMRITTIHAFCQSLLRAFPLEAGLAPSFAVLEEQDARARLAAAREAVLADPRQAAALAVLAGLITAEDFATLSGDLLALAPRLLSAVPPGGLALAMDRLGAALDPSGTGRDLAALAAELAHPPEETALARAAASLALGGPEDAKHGLALRRWLALPPAARAADVESWLRIFLTNEGTIRQRFATRRVQGQAEVQALLEREAGRVRDLAAAMAGARVVEATAALLGLCLPMLEAYARAKAARAELDFDDLIAGASALLQDPGSAWVMYKLDAGIEHVLLDEAQDSNPAQWQILKALTAEFFAGEGQVEAPRSVFAVGDLKQSIYGFQGADPAGFARAREHFAPRVRAAGQRFEAVELDVSFRSTPAVLALVDAVFAGGCAQAGVVEPGRVLRHVPHRAGQGGLVELWPLAKSSKAAPLGPWSLPEVVEEERAAARLLAEALAARIAAMVGQEELPARRRRIRPRDILVLVRNRSAFTGMLIRALKRRGVPVGGLDRMALTAQIGVQDVLATLDALLLPEDDLQLAAALKSPLFGLSEEELFALAHGRSGSLAQALLAEAGGQGQVAAAAERFARWLARADRDTPHELLARILGAEGGRARLLARLGPDAAEGLDELVHAALAYEAREPPSLQGFLHWLRAGGAEVKREAEAGQDEVRVMTAHGAKGLQAPVVILPDTIRQRPPRQGVRWLQPEGGEGELPLWSPRAEPVLPPALEELARQEEARRLEEENRLLYVALTRAEDRLLICGWRGRREVRESDWYAQVEAGFRRLGAAELPFDPTAFGAPAEGFEEGPLLRLEWPAEQLFTEPPAPRPAAAGASLPAFALTPAPPEVAAPALAPSTLLEEEEAGPPPAPPHAPGDPGGLRFRRGRLIHALLQHLPALPPERRREAARAYLDRPGHGLDADSAAALAEEALRLLDHPIFAAEALVEVPIAGRIGGRVYAGQVDRLLLAPDRVLILDFKTNRPVPKAPEEVAPAYLRQMAAYRALLRLSFPGRAVSCALLWTYSARLMELPDPLLDRHAPAP